MDTGLKNRVVVVTGASGGIGHSIVDVLTQESARLVIHCYRGLEKARRLADQVADQGGEAFVAQADLTKDAEVERLFQQIESEFGLPEVLVANAGVWPSDDRPLVDLPLDRWEQTISQNLGSVARCVKRFLASVRKSKLSDPSIVLTGSTAGFFGEAGHSDYATAKAGLMFGFMQSLKNEIPRIAPQGRINAVCPGWTVTPMTDKFTGNEEAVLRALKTIPLDKFAVAKDVANAVAFLASSQLAGHVSGQTLFVSGGMEGRIVNENPTFPST